MMCWTDTPLKKAMEDAFPATETHRDDDAERASYIQHIIT
jgi:hypothetical protein